MTNCSQRLPSLLRNIKNRKTYTSVWVLHDQRPIFFAHCTQLKTICVVGCDNSQTHLKQSIIFISYAVTVTQPHPMDSLLTDQFAFRPTGSTTAALISILQKVTTPLDTNTYVVVYIRIIRKKTSVDKPLIEYMSKKLNNYAIHIS